MADVAVVVTTYNALPWIEQCLESVAGVQTVVVDNDSTDGTAAFVQERFPEVHVVEQPNRGLAPSRSRPGCLAAIHVNGRCKRKDRARHVSQAPISPHQNPGPA